MAKKNPEQKQAAQARRTARQTRAERAKALAAERRRKQKRRQQLITGGVALAVVLVVVAAFFGIRAATDTSGTAGPPEGATEEFGLVVGDENASDKVVIYEDFLCPACGALESGINEQLSAAAEQGKVAVEYRPFELLGRFGDYSKKSANAFAVVLDTAGPEAAKEFHDLLYADQPPETGPFPGDDWLVEKAVQAGATESEVRPGIEDMAFEGWVDNATEASSKAGVTGTPTVLINGKEVQAQTLEEMAQQIMVAAR